MGMVLVGTSFWLAVAWVLGVSAYRVNARAHRETVTLKLIAPGVTNLSVGDSVFQRTPGGLVRIGEVSYKGMGEGTYRLAIDPPAMASLTISTRAVCWRTPLSVEQAVSALFPRTIQDRVSAQIAQAWRASQAEVLAAWKPIIADLMADYIEDIWGDVEHSIANHQDDLIAVARAHADALAADWPAIQARLSPILQEHLIPVLSELMDSAVEDAPKTRIAWSVARGRHARAFQQMLDWLSDYLARMPAEDKVRMRDALRDTWEAARSDDVLVDQVRRIGQRLREDRQLRDTLTRIYREAIADNPKTAAYFRARVLNDPRVRDQTYRFIERFGPAARVTLATCLFDDEGVTRPEVVHLVRSIALGRRVAWVTLETPDAAASRLDPGATLAGRNCESDR